LESHYPAKGKKRATIALLKCCAQQVLAPEINAATIDILTYNGVEVLVPKTQGCCGALAAHTGAMSQAKAFAHHNLKVFAQVLNNVDALVTNAAGCGSGLHEYGLWLRGSEDETQAKELAAKSQDMSVFLARLGMIAPPALARPVKVAYHDACHLLHGQGVGLEPRQLLQSIPGLTLIPIADSEICCGSAGSYNIEHPETAAKLGEDKARAIIATGADILISGNIGCLTQLRQHLAQLKSPIKILHTAEVLSLAYQQKL